MGAILALSDIRADPADPRVTSTPIFSHVACASRELGSYAFLRLFSDNIPIKVYQFALVRHITGEKGQL